MSIAEEVEDVLMQMFTQAHAQFGDAIKAYWFHDSDACPGCGRRIKPFRNKGKVSMSLNAFIYRERGVLIGYFLCDHCVKHIFQAAKKNPYQQTPRHAAIEANLIKAYKKHIYSMDA